MTFKPKLNFEDIAFSDWAEDRGRQLELALAPAVFLLVGIITVLIVLIIMGRLLLLNVYRGDFYQARAAANVNKEIILPANRGLITDRFGEPLTKNIPTFSLALNLTDFLRDPRPVIKNLREIANVLGMPSEELENIFREINPEQSGEATIAYNIYLDQAIALKAMKLEALRVKDDFLRQYVDGPIFAHVLGFAGVTKEDNVVAGRSGLEEVYDDYISGVDGRHVVYRDVAGKVLEEKIAQQSRGGYQMKTTIDADFQRFFYRRFQRGLEQLERVSGTGLALNPKTGEILALVSFPSYDNNRPADYLTASNQPMFNRAVSGVYSPGSVIKPFIAVAALNENIIGPTDSFFSAGYLEIPNPYFPDKPSRFLDWKAHGYVDVYSALAKSSNVYFYIVGGGYKDQAGLGVGRLLDYWKRFGFDQLTAIDLPAEKTGFFYSPEEKEKKLGELWRVGDTYNVSIGQGNLATTPIRLLAAYAGLAMDGKLFRPFVAQEVIDERGNIVLLNQPNVAADYSDLAPEIYEVKKGLADAIRQPYGTARALYNLPITVAGKTGSAQIANNARTNAFFIGYAPVENPEIAILILIENAREGSINTLPIAYDAFNWYYWNRIVKNSKFKNQNEKFR